MKTDSGMRHGRWKHKGQREREGRGMRENRQPKVGERGGGRGYFSRKHILLYYRCSIMSFGSYMVANATFVQSNQLRKAETTQLGLEASCKKKTTTTTTKKPTSNLPRKFQGLVWVSSLLLHLSASSKITQAGMNWSDLIICTWLI